MNVFPKWLDPILKIDGVKAAFVGRVPDIEVSVERAEAVKALEPTHADVVQELGFLWSDCWLAEQVHGNGIHTVAEDSMNEGARSMSGVDGLITQAAGHLLGIYVADCGAVYLVDQKTKAIGLVHSGKKGTEGEIAVRAIERMQVEFGSRAEDLVVVLAPCIRPPHYEIDFAEDIKKQVILAGVPASQYHDCGICTAEEVDAYYSYRLEKGKTGRMLGLLVSE